MKNIGKMRIFFGAQELFSYILKTNSLRSGEEKHSGQVGIEQGVFYEVFSLRGSDLDHMK